MAGVKRGPAGDLTLVVGWLALLWAIFLVDVTLRWVFGIYISNWLALWPRDWHGLPGILTAHFLHADLRHISSNSVALLLLGWLSCKYSRKLTVVAIFYSMLATGSLTWCVGSWWTHGMPHIGASGVVFGLIGWLMANGLFRHDWRSVLMGLVVLVLYGGAIGGVLPSKEGTVALISWEMHLGGFIGGMLASWHLRKQKA